jgi:oligopeptide/dipeptide ABC transporter, ATP-binding protein, C-terminal domain
MKDNRILEIKDLEISFHTYGGDVQAVRGIDLFLNKGETLAIVGESGSGKSVTARSIMGLLPRKHTAINGSILFDGMDLVHASKKQIRRIRGKDIAMIFQDPMTSLNPTMTIERQICEPLRIHQKLSRSEAKKKSVELLRVVGIPQPDIRIRQYPHQFSGGMRQRVVIAVALACSPQILIADEPTTALDVTIQAKILELLNELQRKTHTSIIFITHDLGVVANMADRVAVMYAGKIVEIGTVDEIFYNPKHPYTWGLLCSMPTLNLKDNELYSIPGSTPDLIDLPEGDAFAPRNPYALKIDTEKQPPMFKVSETHYAATWLLDPRAPKVKPPQEIIRREKLFEQLQKEGGAVYE